MLRVRRRVIAISAAALAIVLLPIVIAQAASSPRTVNPAFVGATF